VGVEAGAVAVGVLLLPALYSPPVYFWVSGVARYLGRQVAGLAVATVSVPHSLRLIEVIEGFQLTAFTAFLQTIGRPFARNFSRTPPRCPRGPRRSRPAARPARPCASRLSPTSRASPRPPLPHGWSTASSSALVLPWCTDLPTIPAVPTTRPGSSILRTGYRPWMPSPVAAPSSELFARGRCPGRTRGNPSWRRRWPTTIAAGSGPGSRPGCRGAARSRPAPPRRR